MTPKDLLVYAKEVLNNSYSPYSNFPVGCAILYKDGKVITGVNVENVSFGATNCAERTALYTGITQGYHKEDIEMIVIAGKTDYFLPPCSLCRQVLVELCPMDTPVFLSNNQNELYETSVKELVPLAFIEM
ncbi:cytidine deaminase [Granulicatella balaenopterae]|uniref:Cytidine deaminase n=1 Tax=Granulicatella balaenopterae TaxID=137733 RepID=A0A1H9KKJ9_9LACT|nr:cytidine deaminase [Granulicatella balaenopterae]SEQ99670.1 cytidine deaminase [Granulicatella balaenopterae]